MSVEGTELLEPLERKAPTLFLVGFALELLFAANHGVAYLVDGFAFVDWVYPAVLLGRLAVLLGLVGLSVKLVDRNARVGKLCRGVASVAVVSTAGLMTLSVLANVGFTTPVIAVFGLGTVVLTLLTFLLFGVAIVRTGAVHARIGGLVLVAFFAVLSVFVGLRFLPTGVVAAVGEGVNSVVFLAIWFFLRAEPGTTSARATSDTMAE